MSIEELVKTCQRLGELCEKSPDAKEAMLLTMDILYKSPYRLPEYVPYPVYPQWPVLPFIPTYNASGTIAIKGTLP